MTYPSRLLVSVLLGAIALGCARTPVAPAAPPSEESAKSDDDVTRPGVYTSGRWQYTLAILAEGSKSEGARGDLLFDGAPLRGPVPPGDYYVTPWGPMVWVGDSELPWGDHGWMPRDPAATVGNPLPEPQREK